MTNATGKSGRAKAPGDTGPEEQAPASTIGQRAAEVIERLAAQSLAPGLYLVATPLGNLGDITLRALTVLARADVVYCEDTRHSRTLLDAYGIAARVRPYHEHNAEAERPRILAALGDGRAIALISDAGTPLISDPGFKLTRACVAEGHPVIAIPGPSATLAALCVSGLPTDSFFFAGFLSQRAGARDSRIAELARVPGTLIFFEAPHRLAETLAALARALGPRPAAVARELTKLYEEVRRGTLPELAAIYVGAEVKGEVVVLVGPAGETDVSDDTITGELRPLLDTMSVRDAAKAVAHALSVPRARAYDLALKLKGE